MTDEHEHPPKPDPDIAGDDLRFAPPVEAEADDLTHADDADAAAPVQDDVQDDAQAESAESDVAQDVPQPADDADADVLPTAPEVDLDAALAAISALDDILAEQEAAEQAELERQRAAEQALAERQARMERPEQFFPMPPVMTMQRGRIDSVVPALVLIAIGAWLTLTLTSEGSLPAAPLLILAAVGGLSVTLLARWLASGRWALGLLFFALAGLLTGGLFVVLAQQGSLPVAWPLLVAGPGAAFFLTGILAGDRRLLPPGLLIVLCSLIGLVVTQGLLPGEIVTVAASLWPVVLGIILVLVLLSITGRRQRES